MDLALNNLQRLICHKSQTNKQTNKFNEELCFLAEYGHRNRRTCKILQRLCDSSKSTTCEIYPGAKDGQTLVKTA